MAKFDYNAADRLDWAHQIAQFRYGLIAPVVLGLFSDDSAMDYYRRVTALPLKRPDGTEFLYKPKTLETWKSTYDRGGFDALMPKERSDKGLSRSLTEECRAEIRKLREKFPRIKSVLIYEKLFQDGYMDANTSIRAVQRFVKKEKMLGIAPDDKDRKAFEYASFGILYQADTSFFSKISEHGAKKAQTYFIRILDDHSRLTVGGEAFYEDTGYNFEIVLKKACMTYGIPKMLYVDHGGSYDNKDLAIICANLGIMLLHAPVKDGSAKGKIERSFGGLRTRWLDGFDADSVDSLEEYNEILKDEIRKRNLEVNESTKQSPIDRYMDSEKHVRMPLSQEWLDECFMHRVTRKVRNDATITCQTHLFDVPRQFIGQTVQVRYLPNQWERAYIYAEGKHFPLKLTDKNVNARTRRETDYTIDYSKR